MHGRMQPTRLNLIVGSGGMVRGLERADTSMIIDVYHSGRGRTPRPPFVFVRSGGDRLPDHPHGESIVWNFWKQAPLKLIAVVPDRAERQIMLRGFFIQ